MKKCEIAVFDLDGTLAETDAANSAAYRAALGRFGLCVRGSGAGRICAERIRRELGLGAEEMRELRRVKAEEYDNIRKVA